MSATFYYDFNSPYAYLAAERIDDLIPDAEWKPIAHPFMLHELGRLEEAMGRDPSVARGICDERAVARGLPPLNPPPGWPAAIWSLAPIRAAVFAAEQGRVREFTRAAYRKVFVEAAPLTDEDNVRAAAREAGLDPDAVMEAVGRPDVKQRVKEHTDEALARGVTGIPTVVVGDEVFWGDDRLDEAAAAAVGA